jgi:hypothetical protein
MMSVRALGVVAPMLITTTKYLNLHYATDENGYLKHHQFYDEILYNRLVGCVKVDVVHCTYLVAADVLSHVSYDDGSGRYEYVIFSDVLRKKGIGQYYDNREFYGFITFADKLSEFDAEIRNHWVKQLNDNFLIDWETLTEFKKSYSKHGEDEEVVKFYSGKDSGFYLSVGDCTENVELLSRKYSWNGLKMSNNVAEFFQHPDRKHIDYISINMPGKELSILQDMGIDSRTIGFMTIDTSGWDKTQLEPGYRSSLYNCLINAGYVYMPRETYDIYIHKSMFEGIYYLNSNKAFSHEVTFCNKTNTLTVKTSFPWREDKGLLNSSNFVIQFEKLGRRRLNYNSIELHSHDRWVKLDA